MKPLFSIVTGSSYSFHSMIPPLRLTPIYFISVFALRSRIHSAGAEPFNLTTESF